VSTLYKGNIRLCTPMVYALMTIFLFTIGGVTGLFLGCLNTDIHLHDTYFIVAHFHYVMMGSVLFAFLGGVYHWFPKMFGKMYNEAFGRFASVIVFIGFNWTFFPQFVMGSQGMPRRYATYPEEFTNFHLNSTLGAFTMGIGIFLVLVNLAHALKWGKTAPSNPWGGNTLEWHTTSPPPTENFSYTPVADDPYDYSRWHYVSDEKGYRPLTEEEYAKLPDEYKGIHH
jgi:cytochrome c oxidase subunit 1